MHLFQFDYRSNALLLTMHKNFHSTFSHLGIQFPNWYRLYYGRVSMKYLVDLISVLWAASTLMGVNAKADLPDRSSSSMENFLLLKISNKLFTITYCSPSVLSMSLQMCLTHSSSWWRLNQHFDVRNFGWHPLFQILLCKFGLTC